MSTKKNYITPKGWERLQQELNHLVNKERPEVVQVVNWAASNGDRSENGDYIYGKKRLREIDRRIRFLTKRLQIAEVVSSDNREGESRIFFGATVRIKYENGQEKQLSIVGEDELDPEKGKISWVSPLAQALLGKNIGDYAILITPTMEEEIEILEVIYQPIE